MGEYAMGWCFFTFLGMVCLLLTSANVYFNAPNPGLLKLNYLVILKILFF